MGAVSSLAVVVWVLRVLVWGIVNATAASLSSVGIAVQSVFWLENPGCRVQV